MVSAEFEGTCTMMQSAAAGDPLSPESSYLRGMASAGYPHPEPGSGLPHPHHPHMQVFYQQLSDHHRFHLKLDDSVVRKMMIVWRNENNISKLKSFQNKENMLTSNFSPIIWRKSWHESHSSSYYHNTKPGYFPLAPGQTRTCEWHSDLVLARLFLLAFYPVRVISGFHFDFKFFRSW